MRTWTITELAEEYGVTPRTIRFYEDRGLITPERHGSRRIFHARDRVRLGLVLRGKRLGFSLREIGKILDMYDADPGEVGQLRYLLTQIAQRRRELEQRRRDLDETLRDLDEVEARCRADLDRLTTTDTSPTDDSPAIGPSR
ncbi:MAG TPA: MerR family DNA-binding transcriptional regulator [Actinopolymorphaceae bacterium]